MRHFVIVAVLVAISTFLVSALLTGIGLMPVEASAQAVTIDQLFTTHLYLISFLFSLIVVFIVYSLFVFRKKNEDANDGKYIKGNTGLEVLWTILPLGIVLYFSFLGSKSLADVRRIDPQAMQVKVTAGQWYWSFEYPDYGVTSQTLNLPVNQQVDLIMTSRDVIHSFWVPEFRVKQDILPGENLVKELRLTPTLLGNYKVRCAEFCGGSHAYMESPVIVMTQGDFDTWIQGQLAAVSNDPVARGKKLAADNGCTSCHSLDGKKLVGPTWLGLYGSSVELADGSNVMADDQYITESIIDPGKQIVGGYPPGIMPNTYESTLSEQQILDILAFIQSLK